MAIENDKKGSFDYLRERLSETNLNFCIYDPEYASVWMALVKQFDEEEEDTTCTSNNLDSTQQSDL